MLIFVITEGTKILQEGLIERHVAIVYRVHLLQRDLNGLIGMHMTAVHATGGVGVVKFVATLYCLFVGIGFFERYVIVVYGQ